MGFIIKIKHIVVITHVETLNFSSLSVYSHASLNNGILSEKCVVRKFRHGANIVECTYTNLESIAYYRYASLNNGDTF